MLVNGRRDQVPQTHPLTDAPCSREMTMFRKLVLGLATAASLGVVALAPTSASAFYGGPHFHSGFGFHHAWGGPRFFVARPAYFGGYSCVVRRWVPTPWGFQPRLVNRC